jgi:hypothetical protein
MKKFWTLLLNIVKTIICVPLVIAGVITSIPYAVFIFIIYLNVAVISDIWR